jgi:phage terminase large subunit
MEEAYKAGSPTIIEQGGTRSGKSYNILMWLIVKALTEWDNKVIDIVRETMTSLRASAMFDFFQILEKMDKYDVEKHNKSESIYRIGSNIFRFFGADDDQKVRGPGRDILFCNEINGFKYKAYKQLNQRTKELTIGDYNPSDEFHWIYDHILTDKDTAFFITTFRDNPFLPDRIIKQIKKYKETDPNYWRIYGLGLKGVAQATIYSNWEIINKKWEDIEGQEFFGEDYGFNNPTVILRIKYHKEGIYIDLLLYKPQLTSDQIVKEHDKLKEDGLLNYDDEIFGDCARPEIIEDISRSGYNCRGARKGKDSVLRGINFVKNHKVYVTERSLELIKEFRSYKWKVDKDEHVLDSPVELNDHGMDAIRYGLSTLSEGQGKSGILDASALFGENI